VFAAEHESDDPLCELDEYERLRACTLILSSTYFVGELEFVARTDFIDRTGCTRYTISFQDERVIAEVGEQSYEEWMIGCRPEARYADYQEEYFLSRVYGSEDEVFVYRWAEDVSNRTIVENKFGDVRLTIY
jgi:hypothetical protein